MKHEFVEQIPERLNEDVLYVSIPFETVVHKCACGCGSEVVTPLSPTDWKLTFDGESISLHPSIGNWSFACKSHYWITNSQVRWAPRWSDAEIAEGRAFDDANKARFRHRRSQGADLPMAQANETHEKPSSIATHEPPRRTGGWAALRRWWSGR